MWVGGGGGEGARTFTTAVALSGRPTTERIGRGNWRYCG